MNVEVAAHAGFCFGVDNAINLVLKTVDEVHDKPIYTCGPIIHNEQVVEELKAKGVQPLDIKNMDGMPKGVMILRSHGVGRRTEEDIAAAGFEVVDATCPFVKRIHRIVEKESASGHRVLIIGDRDHPEVKGIMGWCKETPTVVGSIEEFESCSLDKEGEICVVSQTTFNYKKFKEIVDYIDEKGYYITVVNTICNATDERQKAAADLASRADCMIVIGGAHSSNSRKLYEICTERCASTHFIQTLDDLHLELPETVRLVGITAGASTPNNIIEEVQNYVRNEF